MKKLYKISKYSKRIISILMIFFQMRIAGGVSNSFNANSVRNYHQVVESFSEFLRSEGIEDPQQIYEYYNYAMWNGYFSNDHKLQYSLDRKVYLDNAGMSIMSGDAVCLNYADMLSLIFKEMGFNSYMAMCYVDTDNRKVEKIRTDKNIERSIDPNSSDIPDNFLLDTIMKIFGNHAITCVEYNNELYFFDPTNFIYLNKIGINDVSIINGEGKYDLKYCTSLLLENINIFKVATYKNEFGYDQEVLEKQEININLEKLEQFYNSQKQNIEEVAKSNEKNKSILYLVLYSLIASLIINLTKYLSRRIINKIEDNEVKYLFPKLKKYFEEKNIKTEFEVLKNYELLQKELGIKSNMLKDLFEKALDILEILINNRNFHHLMLNLCLVYLGYNSTIIHAKKYSNEFIKKDIVLIRYMDRGYNFYVYDYETEELLCKDSNNVLCSLDGKYKYEIKDYIINDKCQNINKEAILNKMTDENTLLSKEDIKILRKNKTLR